MKTAYIIAEYNPFHNGHRYHIEQTRKLTGAEAVVAVMSGHFVQRGDIAVCDKFLRAQTAVACGADLVTELPVKYAVSNAARFAGGAVSLIGAFGTDGLISFGASASLPALQNAKDLADDAKTRERIETLSRTAGKTFPAALDLLLRESCNDETAALLNDPNNVLAMEYLRAMERFDRLRPLAVERTAERGHHAADIASGFTGAGHIRTLLYQEQQGKDIALPEKLSLVMPEAVVRLLRQAHEEGRFPVDRDKYALAVYSRLLTMQAADFARIDNVSQGLENRIVQAVKESASPQEAINAIKSKRYTMARLRQIFTAAALGITREDAASPPAYIRVLAFNETGRKLLAELRERTELPLVTNLSDAANDPACARDAALEYAADKLFDLCLPIPRGGNRPFLDHPVYIRQADG